MATITEDYVSFEVAKLLKEKGFDARCPMIYTADGEMLYTDVKHHNMYAVTNKQLEYYTDIIAPTLQMAMKWLRNEHNKFIEICMDRAHNFKDIVFRPAIYDKELDCLWESDNFSTYEQACEATIKYCLENLI